MLDRTQAAGWISMLPARRRTWATWPTSLGRTCASSSLNVCLLWSSCLFPKIAQYHLVSSHYLAAHPQSANPHFHVGSRDLSDEYDSAASSYEASMQPVVLFRRYFSA